MPTSRRKISKRRKRRQPKTLTDFFPVERSAAKNGERIQAAQEVDCTASEQSSSAANRLLVSNAEEKQQRKRVWSTLKDFYPVRRSSRKPESEIKKERFQEIEEALLSGDENGLRVCHFDGKGRGVVAARSFARGDFVVEYRGDLIDQAEAKRREAVYADDPNVGCYMYYFHYKNQPYCVDATAETRYLGRLVNHSAKEPNCVTRIVQVRNKPRLILVAARNIDAGEQLLYDYGDRSREATLANPWLINS